jgi:thioredoxin-like negative regulator of GroEL
VTAAPLVLVFVMDGCAACHEYVPRLKRLVGGKVGLHVRDVGRDPRLAAEFGIRATPTTIVRTRSGAVHRRVGSLPDDAVRTLLDRATR